MAGAVPPLGSQVAGTLDVAGPTPAPATRGRTAAGGPAVGAEVAAGKRAEPSRGLVGDDAATRTRRTAAAGAVRMAYGPVVAATRMTR